MTRPTLPPTSPRQGEHSNAAGFPTASQLRFRSGQSFARVAPRRLIQKLTGKSPKSVHLRVHGERPFRLSELAALARSTDPAVNVMHPIADALAVVEGARRTVEVPVLVESAVARSQAEQTTDGTEDVSQLALAGALELLRTKGIAGLSFGERTRVRQAVDTHRGQAVEHCASLMALIADLEALSFRMEEVH